MTRYLIVDDDPLLSEAVQGALEDWFGGEVDCATTRAAGFQLVASRRYDFAMIDAGLPDGPGLALAGLAADLDVSVLLTAEHAHEYDILQQFSYPWLRKPFTLNALYLDAGRILRGTADNIRRVQASFLKMQANVDALKIAMAESQRLLDQAKSITGPRNRSPWGAKEPES